jgi:hypothetical protein
VTPAPLSTVEPACGLTRDAARRLLVRHMATTGRSRSVRVIDSGSMAPLVAGDCLATVSAPPTDGVIRTGTLILVSSPPAGLAALHRVVACRRTVAGHEVLQVPDNLRHATRYGYSWVKASDVLGAVRRIITLDGRSLYEAGSTASARYDALASLLGRTVWARRQKGQDARAEVLAVLRSLALRLFLRFHRPPRPNHGKG